MANEVMICNLALSRVGEEGSVVSLDPPEGGEHASACAAFYQTSLATMLAAHDWRFATRRVRLTELSGVDTHGWKAVYGAPSDSLRIIDIRSAEDTRHNIRMPSAHYEIETDGKNARIYTDCVAPVCRYIVSSPKVGSFPPLFVDALAWHLAMSLSGRVIKGRDGVQITNACLQQYQNMLAQAAAKDAGEKDLPIDFTPEWIKVR